MTVFAHFLRLQRLSLTIWTLAVVVLLAAVVGQTPAVTQDNAWQELLRNLPPAVQRITGGTLHAFARPVDAYLVAKLFNFLPLVLGIFAALSAAAVVARERDRGTIEFLLSLPLDRRRLMRQRLLVVAFGLGLLYLATWAALVVGLKAVGVAGSYGRYAVTLLGGWAVNLAQAGLVTLISLRVKEYVRAVRYGLALVVVAYLIDTALLAANVWTWLRPFLLYGLVNAGEVVRTGQVPWAALGVGLAVAGLSAWWAGGEFEHQQLHS